MTCKFEELRYWFSPAEYTLAAPGKLKKKKKQVPRPLPGDDDVVGVERAWHLHSQKLTRSWRVAKALLLARGPGGALRAAPAYGEGSFRVTGLGRGTERLAVCARRLVFVATHPKQRGRPAAPGRRGGRGPGACCLSLIHLFSNPWRLTHIRRQ